MRRKRSFVARNIRRLRLAKGLTVHELAEKMQLKVDSVCRWETGEYMPRSLYRLRLAEALGVNYHTIFSSEEDRRAAAHDLSEAHRMRVLNDPRVEADARKDRIALRQAPARAPQTTGAEAEPDEQNLSEKEADVALERLIADVKSKPA